MNSRILVIVLAAFGCIFSQDRQIKKKDYDRARKWFDLQNRRIKEKDYDHAREWFDLQRSDPALEKCLVRDQYLKKIIDFDKNSAQESNRHTCELERTYVEECIVKGLPYGQEKLHFYFYVSGYDYQEELAVISDRRIIDAIFRPITSPEKEDQYAKEGGYTKVEDWKINPYLRGEKYLVRPIHLFAFDQEREHLAICAGNKVLIAKKRNDNWESILDVTVLDDLVTLKQGRECTPLYSFPPVDSYYDDYQSYECIPLTAICFNSLSGRAPFIKLSMENKKNKTECILNLAYAARLFCHEYVALTPTLSNYDVEALIALLASRLKLAKDATNSSEQELAERVYKKVIFKDFEMVPYEKTTLEAYIQLQIIEKVKNWDHDTEKK